MMLKKTVRDLVDWWCVIATVIVIAHAYPKETVSTMEDEETGCQFYVTGFGVNLVPRTDGKGQHLGCKLEEY